MSSGLKAQGPTTSSPSSSSTSTSTLSSCTRPTGSRPPADIVRDLHACLILRHGILRRLVPSLCKTASYHRIEAKMLVVCKPLLVNRPDSRRSTMAQSRCRKSSFRMRVPPGSFVARRADITQKRKARLGRSFLQSMAEPMLTRHWRGICSIPWPQRKIAINVVSASCQLRD